MKRLTMTVLTVAVAAFLGACDSDSDGAAPAKCRLLISHFCTRVANCNPGVPDALAQCEAGATMGMTANQDCNKATSVGTNYDLCISQIDVLACNQVTALPVSCAGVINIPK